LAVAQKFRQNIVASFAGKLIRIEQRLTGCSMSGF